MNEHDGRLGVSDSTYARNPDKDGTLERGLAHEGCVAHRALNILLFCTTRYETIQMPDR